MYPVTNLEIASGKFGVAGREQQDHVPIQPTAGWFIGFIAPCVVYFGWGATPRFTASLSIARATLSSTPSAFPHAYSILGPAQHGISTGLPETRGRAHLPRRQRKPSTALEASDKMHSRGGCPKSDAGSPLNPAWLTNKGFLHQAVSSVAD